MLPVPDVFWRVYAVMSLIGVVFYRFVNFDEEKAFKAGMVMIACLAVDSILSAIKKLRESDDA